MKKPTPKKKPSRKTAPVAARADLVRTLRLKDIDLVDSPRVRAELNQAAVCDYADAMNEGATFPPVVVFVIDGKNFLADGRHRVAAARRLGRGDIEAKILSGTRAELVQHAGKANRGHGVRPTAADKRCAVVEYLGQPELAERSDRWIAAELGLAHSFVATIRKEQVVSESTSPRKGADGKRYRVAPAKPKTSPDLEPAVSHRVVDLVRDTAVIDDRRQMAELAKLDDHQQLAVGRAIAKGEADSVREALGQLRAGAKREKAAVLRAAPLPMPDGKFSVISADPPWLYDLREEDDSHRGRCDYPPMTLEEICALGPQVSARSSEDTLLTLWTTNAYLADGGAAEVVKTWGFTGKTVLTWGKRRSVEDELHDLAEELADIGISAQQLGQVMQRARGHVVGRPQIGLGHYLRNSTEHCIIGTRGSPIVELKAEDTLLHAPRREHSRKPDEFFALVEKVFPGPKLELFSREPRASWAQWGSEIAKFTPPVAGLLP